MILRHTMDVYVPTFAANSKGQVAPSFPVTPTYAAVPVDIQPAALSPLQLKEYGLDDSAANAKYCFARGVTGIVENSRASWNGKQYRVLGVNEFPSHVEFWAVPVQGA
jgi:hypothetical protein